MRIFGLLLLSLLVSGCGTTQTYEGPKKAAHEVAILKTYVWEVSIDAAVIAEVDGKDASLYSEVEVLLGRHSVRVIVSTGIIKASGTVSFEAKAGRTYRVKGLIRRGGTYAWIEDESTGEIVAGEKP